MELAIEKNPDPIGHFRGDPINEQPSDLFIPPDALRVFLEEFQGPLDLLLYLIKRQNLSILDIPVAEITHQYVAYLELMTELKIELAADYLLMAAILAEIKSKLLLPKVEDANPEEEDPRAELIRRLQEYERYQMAAQNLDSVPRMERDFFEVTVDTSNIKVPRVFPEVEFTEIYAAFGNVMTRLLQMVDHQIKREPFSVRLRMTGILNQLNTHVVLKFTQLLHREEGRAGAVVTLLALLELSKERIIEILQEDPLGPIQVRMIVTESNRIGT
jgi:segregation and condensation protein A